MKNEAFTSKGVGPNQYRVRMFRPRPITIEDWCKLKQDHKPQDESKEQIWSM